MNIFLDYFEQFTNFIITFCKLLNSNIFSITLQLISLSILSKIFFSLAKSTIKKTQLKNKKNQFIFFVIPIIAIMVENIAWITKFILPQSIVAKSIIYFAWMLSCFKFHSLTLFVEKLISKSTKIKSYHKIFFTIEAFLCTFLIFDYTFLANNNYHLAISQQFHYAIITFWFVSFIPSLKIVIENITLNRLPIVLNKQIQVLFSYLMIPHLLFLTLEFLPFLLYGEKNNIIFANIGIIFITSAFYFCYKKIMQFRFLNSSNQVQKKPYIQVATSFKDTIEQINFASNNKENQLITKNFFSEQFNIEKKNINFYIRSNNTNDVTYKKIEHFLNDSKNCDVLKFAHSHKIFVHHEIEFDTYYTNSTIIQELCSFLKQIDSEIFLPLLNNKHLIGYITVTSEDFQKIYSYDEQNKMIVFAQFLAPTIHMLAQQNIHQIMQETKAIKEDLYAKHQEINQYKESIKKLLKDRIENHIGIIFYKNKHFSFRNKEAQSLIGMNPNLEHTSPTTATLLNLAQQVEKFKSTQSMCITIQNGKKLIITAMPYTEPSGGVIMTVRHPEATDIIKLQLDTLHDSSKRDYLLYLETTEAGKLINRLLPSNNEEILQTKINLLEASLQKNALLLESHNDDVNEIAKIIHQISNKESLHILNLKGTQSHECALKLFGINQLLEKETETPLLEKLDQGTLVINNVENLDKTTQQKLAYFIRYGIYSPLKSEQRKFSNVRIICSTGSNIQSLVNEGLIAKELYEELKKSPLNLPSLVNFAQEDLCDLIDGYTYQGLQENSKEKITPLTIKEKEHFIQKGISSIFEFKQKIQNIMIAKTKEIAVNEETLHKKSFSYKSCPELELASQLGKHALKDQKLMTTLWEKIGNQTKIANLLGVNRSSVNRRCKDYNLV